ncbi:MAG TPA: LamG-like jellyroll fold domain-containing protein, partial [Gemmataceae bacterium]|nr:LamG-like jellyroll fold domain-containing protein [Gemmataceae bacterium]
LRAGLDGHEYFESPRPRWESLHDLQGLLELWRITGETKYRDAFVHHWRSIRRWDRHNTGAFSSGEQATGNPYAPTAIETCCTVAWMTLTSDYLRLTGDPHAADDLELATLNGGLGAQHPSGRWWTYNTPMDGVREASAHTIVFQARAGTPELNCCSVNGPRVLGLLSEWAVIAVADGAIVNSYLPGTFTLPHAGHEIHLEMDRDYPRTDSQRAVVRESGDTEWTLWLRIPAWSTHTRIQSNFAGAPTQPPAGSYVEIRRLWKAGDEIILKFNFGLRAVAGANEAASKVSLYRGPLLLAYDQACNSFDEDKIPALNLARLATARVVSTLESSSPLQPEPWLQMDLPAEDGRSVRLIDFASAGSAGTRYRSWLPVVKPLPPPAFTQFPRDGQRLRPGPAQFQWRGARRALDVNYRVEIAADPEFNKALFATNGGAGHRLAMDLAAVPLAASSERWWRVVSVNANGETIPDVPPARFVLDAAAPPQVLPPELKPGPKGEVILHSLRGEERPKFGELISAKFTARSEEGTRVNGRDQMLVYSVPVWPEADFTVTLRVRVDEMPQARIGQIFSAWAAGMDDPLRLVVDHGKLFARVEAGGGYGTPGVSIEAGRWYHVAAVKRGATLSLFLDGRPAGSGTTAEFTTTAARDCALGGNPHFSGNEFLAGTFADFGLWARALTDQEVVGIAGGK